MTKYRVNVADGVTVNVTTSPNGGGGTVEVVEPALFCAYRQFDMTGYTSGVRVVTSQSSASDDVRVRTTLLTYVPGAWPLRVVDRHATKLPDDMAIARCPETGRTIISQAPCTSVATPPIVTLHVTMSCPAPPAYLKDRAAMLDDVLLQTAGHEPLGFNAMMLCLASPVFADLLLGVGVDGHGHGSREDTSPMTLPDAVSLTHLRAVLNGDTILRLEFDDALDFLILMDRYDLGGLDNVLWQLSRHLLRAEWVEALKGRAGWLWERLVGQLDPTDLLMASLLTPSDVPFMTAATRDVFADAVW